MNGKRDAYIQKLKAKINEWNADLDKLSAKADMAEGEAKIRYLQQMEDLRAKRKDIANKIDALKDVSESVWEDLRQGIETSWETWKENFHKARSEFEKGYKQGRKK